MKTLKVRLNTNTDHYEEDFGPPLPHSMELWRIWGCYDSTHPRCVTTSRMEVGRTTSRFVTYHETAEEVYAEHIKLCKNSPGCTYFIHWLVGELEAPGGNPCTLPELTNGYHAPTGRTAGPPTPAFQCGKCEQKFLDPDDCLMHAVREHPKEENETNRGSRT